MKLLRMIAVDLREGTRAMAGWYGVATVVFALLAIALHVQAALCGYPGKVFSLGDYLLFFTAGMRQFAPWAGERFQFPSAWAAVFLLGTYMTLWYPYRDLMGMGKQMIAVGGSRWVWWISKCVWVVCSTTLFAGIGIAVAAGAALVTGGAMDLRVAEIMPTLLNLIPAQTCDPPYEVLPQLALVPLALASLCLVQLAFSLLLKPLFSYMATVALLFLSAFYFSPWLPGEYLMVVRSAVFTKVGFGASTGVLLCAALACAACVVGGWAFSRMDVLNKENMS